MKTIVKITLGIALLLFTYTEVSAQQTHNPNLIPFSQFAPDTMAYLKANFYLEGSLDFYKGRPIKYLLDDLIISLKEVNVRIDDDTKEIHRLALQMTQTQEQLNNWTLIEFPITLQTGIKPAGELYQKMVDGHSRGYWRAYDDEFRHMIEPLIIGEIRLAQLVY